MARQTLSQKLGGVKLPSPRKGWLWKGPQVDGITQSLLSRFLVCPERFRLLVMEGLTEDEGFSKALEYGNMWHVCEEEFARTKGADDNWQRALLRYAKKLAGTYRHQQEEVDKWYNVCLRQFPIYLEYWKKHPEVIKRNNLFAEVSFAVPYVLPSERVVLLRGKWDSIDLIKDGKKSFIRVQENKTKGDIREQQIMKQLRFDLQTMLYATAFTTLQQYADSGAPDGVDIEKIRPEGEVFGQLPVNVPFRGIMYNVVRRPLSGGKGSIVQHKPTKSNPDGESKQEYFDRLGGIIAEEPEYWFMRWWVELTQADIDRFKRECLDPILESLCDWWEFISIDSLFGKGSDPFAARKKGEKRASHYRLPYGIYNPIADGGSTSLDEYLATGSEVGLKRTDTLFPELE